MVTRKKPTYKARCPICNGARGILLLQTIGGITVLAHKDCVKAMSPDYYAWWDERARFLSGKIKK